MRLATFNLRYDVLPDNITVQQSLDAQSAVDPLQPPKYLGVHKEQPWSLRRLRVVEMLLREDIEIVGFQEVLIRQVRDLEELLGKEWKWIGVGREDGIQKGEFSPIFYKHAKFTCISSDSFWLSDTPFTPSKYPDAGCPRLCTVGRFQVVANIEETRSQEITIINTHLDHQSDKQRQLAASLILQRAHFETLKTGDPIFVLGDFNSASEGPDSAAYQILTGRKPSVPIPMSFSERYPANSKGTHGFNFHDLRAEAPRRSVSPNFATFTGFRAPNDTRDWARIDFIFGASNKGWTVAGYDVVTSLFDDGVLASDHRLICAGVTLSKD